MAKKKAKKKNFGEEVSVFIDGAYSQATNTGGWGVVVLYTVKKGIEFSGVMKNPKNADSLIMEMTAAVKALEHFKTPSQVKIYTDCQILAASFAMGEVARWKENGWKKDGGGLLPNAELWRKLEALAKKHRVTWVKVKAHSGNQWHDVCDKLAKTAIRGAGEVQPRKIKLNPEAELIKKITRQIAEISPTPDITNDIDKLITEARKLRREISQSGEVKHKNVLAV